MKDRNFCALGLAVLVACSSESATQGTTDSDAGRTATVGGSIGLGGTSIKTANSSGGVLLPAAGNPNGGATQSVGGLSSIGGTSTAIAEGGSFATGGLESIGGYVSAGGLWGQGGNIATGGSAIGGTSTTGGAPITMGGSTATGGVATGGVATGGVATGGVATGGTATGGVATGGTATGGTATGGTATGGAATGGTATGGAATGGTATGGTATGGTATGGAATGGAATGGTATGGTATGGVATGGAATGGTATGGAATGGAATGGATCTAPASPSALQFVDPAAGTDDDLHGGAFGECAYKSLTFALTRATGQIALQAATYSATTETFPIVLTGAQQLLCKYNIATSAVIQGKGLDTVTNIQTTVAFRGNRNALNNCTVDGNGGSGYCVHITSSGSFSSSPHVISGSDIGNCGGAAITIKYANNVTVTGSSIHNNQIGVSWLGPNTGGSMLSNKFRANSIADIQCSIADPGVTGSGNTALGSLFCSVCGNCPF